MVHLPERQILKGSGRVVDDGRGHPVRKYFSLKSDCDLCPMRHTCISAKAKTKKVQHSVYKPELEIAKARQQSIKGRIKKRQRSSTVEPVWGTLINFLGLRRMTSRGLKCANQALLLASVCYNIKKYMKYITKKTKTTAMVLSKAIDKTLSFLNPAFYALIIFKMNHQILKQKITGNKFSLS